MKTALFNSTVQTTTTALCVDSVGIRMLDFPADGYRVRSPDVQIMTVLDVKHGTESE